LPGCAAHDNSDGAVAKRSIESVALVVKRDGREAVSIARSLGRWLRGEGRRVIAEDDVAEKIGAEPVSRSDLAERADLIVVLGGDGTLLSVARLAAPRATPILGVNLGGLGFLTEVTVKEAKTYLARVLAGDYKVDRRLTLESIVIRAEASSRGAERFTAVNDVVLNRGPLGHMLFLDVTANRQPFCSYRSDGLIIATPTGSTAYALSAGGPILFPTLAAMVLAPICPHTLSHRPVVLPDSFEIEVRVMASDHDATLTVDGQESALLGPDDSVRIRRGRHGVALVRSPHPYFEIWRDKLRWG
jgi:NAD+ kinase